MNSPELISKVTQVLQRPDGSEAKIVATAMFGTGLHRSVDVYVLRRESPEHDWSLCDNRPHPDYLTMSVDEYIKRGRSEMLRTVTTGEILKISSLIGQPVSVLH